MRVVSMRGLPCPYSEAMVFCQEGYCQDCQIYLDATVNVASLKKEIQIKRDDAFNASLTSFQDCRIKMQAQVNAYDVTLALIDKEVTK